MFVLPWSSTSITKKRWRHYPSDNPHPLSCCLSPNFFIWSFDLFTVNLALVWNTKQR